jgi:hypothetical protein
MSGVTEASRIYMDRPAQLSKVMEEGLALFRKKNKDYGDAFADCGPVGVLVRM